MCGVCLFLHSLLELTVSWQLSTILHSICLYSNLKISSTKSQRKNSNKRLKETNLTLSTSANQNYSLTNPIVLDESQSASAAHDEALSSVKILSSCYILLCRSLPLFRNVANAHPLIFQKLQTIAEDFCGLDVNTPLGGELPVSAVPVLLFNTRLTAVAATSTGDFTVVFIGTATGHLRKVSVEPTILKLNSGNAVGVAGVPRDGDANNKYMNEGLEASFFILLCCKGNIHYVEWCSARARGNCWMPCWMGFRDVVKLACSVL